MRRDLGLAGALCLAAFATPLQACLPTPPLTDEQLRASAIRERERSADRFRAVSDVVYGVVTRPARNGGIARFRILHVYKGVLRTGATIDARSIDLYTLHPPDCLMVDTSRPALVSRGDYGILAFSGERPVLDFLDPCTLDHWFRSGWIRRNSAPGDLFDGSGLRCAVYEFRPPATAG